MLNDKAARAQALAQSALEHALSAVAAHLDDGGRRSNIFASASPTVTLADGTMGWSLRRIDGSSLANSDEPIVVHANASSGQARRALRATLVPSGRPFDPLDTALYAGDKLRLSTLARITADRTIGAISEVNATAALVYAPTESAGSIRGATYFDTTQSNAQARRMPDPSLIEHYAALGTRINLATLPQASGIYRLENALLSPANNPFGPTNPYGIYVIDCVSSAYLHVRNVRILGTLVILDADKNRVIMGNNVLLQPAFRWMPSLLVRGGITFMGTTAGPSEATLGINLNPPHSPYRLESDSDTADTYPGRIEGLAYVTGDAVVAFPGQAFAGTLIAGDDVDLNVSVQVNFTYDPAVATLPPLGFFEDLGGLALDPSSITWQTPD